MKPATSPALERDALYAKSQVYVRRGLRAQADGDTEEYQLWASLALELLGKAALANVHPALVADPTHYQSLFSACGRQISADIKTITAKTLFERLSHIDKAFDSRHQKFCEQIAIRRNAELHSGESPFSGMAAEVWEREFWGAIEAILNMQAESLESWLGAQDSKAPQELLKQAIQAAEWAVQHRISRHREDFEAEYRDPRKRAEMVEMGGNRSIQDYEKKFNVAADAWERHDCPACGAKGFLGGQLWEEEVVDVEDPDDPWIEYTDETYTGEEYVCPTCDLHLFGTKELEAAGLSKEFVVRVERERDFEPGYGND
jgi:hypothetical protein